MMRLAASWGHSGNASGRVGGFRSTVNLSFSFIAVSVREAIQKVSAMSTVGFLHLRNCLPCVCSCVLCRVMEVRPSCSEVTCSFSFSLAGYAATDCSYCRCMTWMGVMMIQMRRKRRGKEKTERRGNPCLQWASCQQVSFPDPHMEAKSEGGEGLVLE